MQRFARLKAGESQETLLAESKDFFEKRTALTTR